MLTGMRELGVEVEMDRMGNVIGYVPGRSHDRKFDASAHTDEVGLMVKYITDEGLIYFDQNGMISAMCLPSAKVAIVTRERMRHRRNQHKKCTSHAGRGDQENLSHCWIYGSTSGP